MSTPHPFFPDEVSDVDTLTDDQIVSMNFSSDSPNICHISIILKPTSDSSTSIVKVGGVNTVNEYRALALVRVHTSIPVPTVRRFFVQGSCSYIVMECIKGKSVLGDRLDQCWGKMSEAQQLIRTPRLVEIPGPLGHAPLLCEGPHFSVVGAGPFASYEALKEWFNDRLKNSKQWKKVRWVSPPFNHDGVPLVFTRHQDLGMQSIIIGEDGRV
ncbi:hypothetical protein HYDPIDRAFT_44855 [Hydnomerulius pinastri MD-312]|uniref:Uncharacterized protein n=1 Tax=Hydnomerulius pinastri MD-312 TaxID=994086 RepID=A0A0C9W6C0_9AGAM|nr:hypothetical protein HYDPIDRAFT_44855 [Hydnomerulius pinastri MD-312]